ncbi:MAG: hypothetical protein WC205_07090 [Opitutaceae bacterium]|jgi:hypothetical protein
MATKSVHSTSQAETIRSEHLRHETTINMIGQLYYVGAAFLVIAAVVSVVQKHETAGQFAIMLGLLAAGFAFAGYMLRRLDARARYCATLMAVLGLVAFPIGTVLNAYVLYLIHVKKGRTVLSPEYREVVAATPEFKARVAHSALALGIVLVGVTVYRVLMVFLHT